MKKAIKAVGRFLYRVSGVERLVLAIQTKILNYKLRLRMIPVSYKVFISLLNVVIGASGMYVYIEAPRAVQDILGTSTVIIENVQAKEMPKEIEEVKIEGPDVKEIVKKVYRLESSGGKNDSCKIPGKVNGYGFGVYGGKSPCFDSHEEVTALVEDWFQKRLDRGMTVGQAACLYNTGTASDDCPYYQKFLSL